LSEYQEPWHGGHTYYVIFDKMRSPVKNRWWHFLVSNKYNHCFVIAAVDEGRTMMINPLHWGIYTNVFERNINDTLKFFLNYNVTAILEWQVKVNPECRWKFRGMYSCVTIVRAILNVDGLAITPKALYKLLLAKGSKRIFLQER